MGLGLDEHHARHLAGDAELGARDHAVAVDGLVGARARARARASARARARARAKVRDRARVRVRVRVRVSGQGQWSG